MQEPASSASSPGLISNQHICLAAKNGKWHLKPGLKQGESCSTKSGRRQCTQLVLTSATAGRHRLQGCGLGCLELAGELRFLVELCLAS